MPLFGSGHEVVTSTTRPSVPTDGQIIYETDTKRILVYNGTSWVIVDNLSLTYTPAFWVRKLSSMTGGGTVVFDNTVENIGTHYSTSTGLFTVPVAGLYTFTCQTIATTPGSYWCFRLNGTNYVGPTPYKDQAGYSNLSASININLSVGNTVGIYNIAGQFYGDGGNIHNNFSGSLISYR